MIVSAKKQCCIYTKMTHANKSLSWRLVSNNRTKAIKYSTYIMYVAAIAHLGRLPGIFISILRIFLLLWILLRENCGSGPRSPKKKSQGKFSRECTLIRAWTVPLFSVDPIQFQFWFLTQFRSSFRSARVRSSSSSSSSSKKVTTSTNFEQLFLFSP